MTTNDNSLYEYEKNEIVLSFHKGLRYRAQIEDRQIIDSPNGPKAQYKVHYTRWNRRWDEWVDPTRLMKYDEAVLVLQNAKTYVKVHQQGLKSHFECPCCANPKLECPHSDCEAHFHLSSMYEKHLQTEHHCQAQCEYCEEKKTSDSTQELSSLSEPFGKRPRTDQLFQNKINFPKALQFRLIADSNKISQSKNLTELPNPYPVSVILDEYSKNLLSSSEEVKSALRGLEVYFNRAFGLFLLYKFERLQYYEFALKTPNFVPSNYYGPEHLLRLFIKLPVLILEADISEVQTAIVVDVVNGVLDFLGNNLHFFASRYFVADRDYVMRSQKN